MLRSADARSISEVNHGADAAARDRSRRTLDRAAARAIVFRRSEAARLAGRRRPARRRAGATSTTVMTEVKTAHGPTDLRGGRAPARSTLPDGIVARSSPSPATSASASRSRSASSAWPSRSTRGRPSSTRSSGRWARRVIVCAAGRHDQPGQPGRPSGCSPTSPSQTYEEILGRARRPRSVSLRGSGGPAGPVELPIAGGSGPLGRAGDLPGQRRDRPGDRRRARRSSSSATSPRPAGARPSARRSSGSCRTSCARPSRRSTAGRGGARAGQTAGCRTMRGSARSDRPTSQPTQSASTG